MHTTSSTPLPARAPACGPRVPRAPPRAASGPPSAARTHTRGYHTSRVTRDTSKEPGPWSPRNQHIVASARAQVAYHQESRASTARESTRARVNSAACDVPAGSSMPSTPPAPPRRPRHPPTHAAGTHAVQRARERNVRGHETEQCLCTRRLRFSAHATASSRRKIVAHANCHHKTRTEAPHANVASSTRQSAVTVAKGARTSNRHDADSPRRPPCP